MKRSEFVQSLAGVGGLVSLASVLNLSTRSAQGQQAVVADEQGQQQGMSKFERDRLAILGMAGNCAVEFSFKETLPLVQGYELKEPYTTPAQEWVAVVRDEGELIELQHTLLVGGGALVKHWSQIWTYEPETIMSYRGDAHWDLVETGDVGGQWAQFVTQVDDSPRYESVGSWVHGKNSSVWEGGRIWRPLPRRDYTKRDDYQVLGCVNRHVVSPLGWVHEQDNVKLVRQQDGKMAGLVRETGTNSYLFDAQADFSAAEQHWEEHGQRWLIVKKAWLDLYQRQGGLELSYEDHGAALGQALSELVERSEVSNENLAASMRALVAEFRG